MPVGPAFPLGPARLLLPILGMLAACGPDSTPTEQTGPDRASAATSLIPPALLQRIRPAPAQPGSGPLATGCSGGCPADSVLIDFEGLGGAGDILLLQDQYETLGIRFANAIVAVIPAFNSDEFPPRSGVASATADPFLSGDGSGTLFLVLDDDAVRVRGYVTSFSPLTLRCFNAQGAPLAETGFPGGNLAVHHGGPANQPVEVSAAGIRSCQFLGPDNQYAIDDLTVVWGEGVDLTLSCPSTVVRADPAVCTASAPGAFTFEVVGWSFRPAEIDTVLQREDVSPTDTTWGGPMVASGLVRVRALVNGTLDSADASIVVKARDWSSLEVELDLTEDSPGALPARPDTASQLGHTSHDLVLLDRMMRVPDGPNTGIFHFTMLPVRVRAVVSINTLALQDEGPFFNRQFPTRRIHQGELHCARSEMVGLYLPGVRRHEGIGGRTDLNSHVALYTAEVETRARERFESLVWTTAFPSMTSELEELDAPARAASKSIDHPTSTLNPFQPDCRLRYWPQP